MLRYIDVYKIPYHVLSNGKGLCLVAFLEDIIKVSTVDVVEVVRCEDCKHNYRRKTWNHGKRDNPSCKYIKYIRDNDFYCKYGERAENE